MKYFSSIVFFFVFYSLGAQDVNIPDANFLQALINNGVDSNGNGTIQIAEAEQVLSLDISNSMINSLEGIKEFKNIETLLANDNSIQELDLNGLNELVDFDIEDNDISELDLSGLSSLEDLSINLNPIESINVSGCVQLKSIFFNGKSLVEIDLSNCINLVRIIFYNTSLTSLNFNGFTVLDDIMINSNDSLFSLKVEGCNNLTKIQAQNNDILEEFEVSNCPKVTEINIENNNIQTLSLTNQAHLTELKMEDNPIVNVDLSGCSSLITFYLEANTVESVNVDGCISMYTFSLHNSKVETLTLPPFSNLYIIFLSFNSELKYLDITDLQDLSGLNINDNGFEQINLTRCSSVLHFDSEDSCPNLREVIFEGCTNMISIDITNANVESLNLTGLNSLLSLNLANNNLNSLYLKNGINDTQIIDGVDTDLSGNPNLSLICVDDIDIPLWTDFISSNLPGQLVYIGSFCPDALLDTPYYMEGKVIFDGDNNGCDENDILLSYNKIEVINNSLAASAFSDSDGLYSIPVFPGEVTLNFDLQNANFFNVEPASFTAIVPDLNPVIVQDFCVTAEGELNRLDIEIIPVAVPRPGFTSSYKIIYTNKGNQILNGSVILNYRGAVMEYKTSSENPSAITDDQIFWVYSDLAPFEERVILVDFLLNSPMDDPPLNGDDIIDFLATVTGENMEGNSILNNFPLRQLVVNSFDPNDKTCLQGGKLYPEMIGAYLHYLIRFENTGTASAVNIRIEDIIDTTVFEINTLQPTDASHNHRTQIEDGNVVHFIFDNINLPFDDENNDGYVAFKIKTKEDLVLGDQIDNYASIFFDFNFPIITNVASTVVTEPTSTEQVITDKNIIDVFPNPFTDVLNIKSEKAILKIEVFQIDGTRIYSKEVSNLKNVILDDLASDGYVLMKIYTQDEISVVPIIKLR